MNFASWGMSYSQFFRELAGQAEERAARDRQNPNVAHYDLRDGSRITYTPHALEAVILSVTALEAGANEMARFVALGFVRAARELPADFEGLQIPAKWATLAASLAGHNFPKGERPWQDFTDLVSLRNELVHFKWQRESVPNFMRSLQARQLTLPDLPGTYWVDAALTDRTAHWARETADAMFAALHAAMGRPEWAWR